MTTLENCSICLHEKDGTLHALDCNHSFHVQCICNWFRFGGSTCPECRQEPVRLPWRDACSRGKYLYSRNREKCKKFQKERNRINNKKLVDFRKLHGNILKQYSQLVRNKSQSMKSYRKAIRNLGLFTGPNFPLIAFPQNHSFLIYNLISK